MVLKLSEMFLCVVLAQLDISGGSSLDDHEFLHRQEAGEVGTRILRTRGHQYKLYAPVPLYAYARRDVGPQGISETYDYYTLPFCWYKIADYKSEHLGEVWADQRLVRTPYQILFRVDIPYKALCYQTFSASDLSKLRTTIARDYHFQMVLDNYPIEAPFGKSENLTRKDTTAIIYYHYLHIHFDISYIGNRVVDVNLSTDPARAEDISEVPDYSGVLTVGYSYSVKWRESDIPPGFRLPEPETKQDTIFLYDPEMGWYAIINPSLVVLVLAGVLAVILTRAHKERFEKWVRKMAVNQQNTPLGPRQQAKTSCFPVHLSLLCAWVGTGTQILMLVSAIMILALVGVSPFYNRGALLLTRLVLYPASAATAGYLTAAEYKIMCGLHWERPMLKTAGVLPIPSMLMAGVLDLVTMAYGSPLPASLTEICFFVLITWPSSYFGARIGNNVKVVATGFSRRGFNAPHRRLASLSEVPDLSIPWYRRTLPQMLLAGALGFYAIYIQLLDGLRTVWGIKVYTNYPVLATVFIMLVTVTALITMILTFSQLAKEDHRWWWRSFLCGGSTSLFMFAYGLFYYFTKSDIASLMETSLFFGHMAMGCSAFFLMLGAVGYWSSLHINRGSADEDGEETNVSLT